VRTIDLDIHAGSGVAHPSFKLKPIGELVHKGAEAYSLDDSLHLYLQTRAFSHCYPISVLSQVYQANRPSPVWQETGKVSTP